MSTLKLETKTHVLPEHRHLALDAIAPRHLIVPMADLHAAERVTITDGHATYIMKDRKGSRFMENELTDKKWQRRPSTAGGRLRNRYKVLPSDLDMLTEDDVFSSDDDVHERLEEYFGKDYEVNLFDAKFQREGFYYDRYADRAWYEFKLGGQWYAYVTENSEFWHELKFQEAAANRANDEVIHAIWVLKTYGFADDRLMEIARAESFQRTLANTRRSAYVYRVRMLAEAREESRDVHKETAAKMFGVPIEEVTSEQRKAAKSASFHQV